jgi:hypothetical protein
MPLFMAPPTVSLESADNYDDYLTYFFFRQSISTWTVHPIFVNIFFQQTLLREIVSYGAVFNSRSHAPS